MSNNKKAEKIKSHLKYMKKKFKGKKHITLLVGQELMTEIISDLKDPYAITFMLAATLDTLIERHEKELPQDFVLAYCPRKKEES